MEASADMTSLAGKAFPVVNFMAELSNDHMREGWKRQNLSDRYLNSEANAKNEVLMNIPERHLGKIDLTETKDLMQATMTLLDILDPIVDL